MLATRLVQQAAGEYGDSRLPPAQSGDLLHSRRPVGARSDIEAAGRARAAAVVPLELQARLAAEFYEQHYQNRLDTPVPALGNRTPRRAARLKTVRSRVIALLKDFENRSERLRRQGKPAYDFGWMWDELGLRRPEPVDRSPRA